MRFMFPAEGPFAAAVAILALLVLVPSCKKVDDPLLEPTLRILIAFDPDQDRLDNSGKPASIPAGRAGQDPEFRDLCVFTIELAPDQWTLPSHGHTLYKALETDEGGDTAIDFDELPSTAQGDLAERLDLADIPPGTYRYLRASVAYQNYLVYYNLLDSMGNGLAYQQGAVSSFLGYNTYIRTVTPYEIPLEVNANRKQGFWAFETHFNPPFDVYNQVLSGQAPEGSTTVVNPLAGIVDIPPGSCIVTGAFDEPLVITGEEEESRRLTLSFSTNRSFEWIDSHPNGEWDFFLDDGVLEEVVDMGLRGLQVSWNAE